ncbi:winged helix-turn-helix domain-containing protein [Streptomyces sp. NPDC126499]|uniref:GntR family transcriptional regulator n=1 Tax=Streptomyces sp. NPDC126499 TaxID=3155314 RepID=UPI0033282E88
MVSRSPRGTYLLVAEKLRGDITEGLIEEELPSEASLMQLHKVSRNTVRRALKELEKMHLIAPVPGIGWRVTQDGSITPLSDRMVALISEDGLKIGDRYPSEAALCQRFGVSRTAVRRALALMEGSGLLNTVRGKGRTVRALPASPEQP